MRISDWSSDVCSSDLLRKMSIRRATFFDVVAVISRKCILSPRRANSTYPQSRVSPDRVTPSSCLFELPRLNRPSAKLNLPLENVATQITVGKMGDRQNVGEGKGVAGRGDSWGRGI